MGAISQKSAEFLLRSRLVDAENGDVVLAKLNDGRVFFKWFHRTGPEGQKIKLSSENPNYAPMEFSKEDFQFIYPAWELKRLLRR